MSDRYFKNWIETYLEFTENTETPEVMHFWAAASALGAVLGRNVWFDQKPVYTWYPNLYIVFVGPPEIVRKSATIGRAEMLVSGLNGINIGPTISTWQSLVSELEKAQREVEVSPGVLETESCLYISAGELGSFLDTEDEQIMNTLISMWDGARIDKKTKCSGNEKIEHPCLNFIGCTTPSWFDRNMPVHIAEGGLFTRIVFVYADKRKKRICYPVLHGQEKLLELQECLQNDLSFIQDYRGEVVLSKEALEWSLDWYEKLCDAQEAAGQSLIMTRQQPLLHKLAMILAASQGSVNSKGRLLITKGIFEEASLRIKDLAAYREVVFGSVGRTTESRVAQQMLKWLRACGSARVCDMMQKFHTQVPKQNDFKQLLEGMVAAGYCELHSSGEGVRVVIKEKGYVKDV